MLTEQTPIPPKSIQGVNTSPLVAPLNQRILVVEDEEDLQELLRFNLTQEGFHVTCVGTGEEALELAQRGQFDCVLLDLMLPRKDGYEVCRALKRDARYRFPKVIIVSARGEDLDVVTGLDIGADDYVPKPFNIRILLARLRAHLRDAKEEAGSEQIVSFGPITLNQGRMEVHVAEVKVEMTFTEFKILQLLMQNPGWGFSRYQIVDSIRGENHAVTDRAVDVQIVSIRRKLGSHGDLVETVRGVGYRLKDLR